MVDKKRGRSKSGSKQSVSSSSSKSAVSSSPKSAVSVSVSSHSLSPSKKRGRPSKLSAQQPDVVAAPSSPKRGRGRPASGKKTPAKPKKQDGRGRPRKILSPEEAAAKAAKEALKKTRGRGRPPKNPDEKKVLLKISNVSSFNWFLFDVLFLQEKSKSADAPKSPRGRPRKVVPSAPSPSAAAAAPPASPAKKGRGRPKKEESKSPKPVAAGSESSKKRGRPRKEESSPKPSSAAPGSEKKRGRPRKEQSVPATFKPAPAAPAPAAPAPDATPKKRGRPAGSSKKDTGAAPVPLPYGHDTFKIFPLRYSYDQKARKFSWTGETGAWTHRMCFCRSCAGIFKYGEAVGKDDAPVNSETACPACGVEDFEVILEKK